MTTTSLRVPVTALVAGELTLGPQASRYVARVRRLSPGDAVLLFDPEQVVEADAVIVAVVKDAVVCRVGPVRPASRMGRRDVTLLQGVGKGDKLDAVVRDATELGATRIVAVETARTVLRLRGLGDKRDARLARWRRVAVEAARQAGRGDVPRVEGPFLWKDAIALPGAVSASAPPSAVARTQKLCLWEDASEPLGPALRSVGPNDSIVIAVGPEGGLEPEEVDAARGHGFAIVSLGPLILRTETVAAAVLGAVLVQNQS